MGVATSILQPGVSVFDSQRAPPPTEARGISTLHGSTVHDATSLLTLCPARPRRPPLPRDSVRTGRRASRLWPLPRSKAPGGSGSCGLAASTQGQRPAVLSVAQPPHTRQGWEGPGGGRRRCWDPGPALGGSCSHRGWTAGGRRCTGSTAYLKTRHQRSVNKVLPSTPPP